MNVRTFVAVEFDPVLKAALTRRLRYLRQICPSLHWVDPENLHLTLTFLGELDQSQLSAATQSSLAAAAGCAPFPLQLKGLGAFGPPETPRVVWAGLGGDLRALRRLHADLVRELTERNLPLADDRFSPHITLARLNRRLPDPESQRLLSTLARPEPPRSRSATQWVDHIAVMKSELARPSARYTRLAFCPLQSAATD